ncbi:hypothetical protein SAY86_019285 [Trapa natans]|uniref:Uncharacterized protein n=1 Tax=Trapa natans TaxID=22666 RepID=A0AAN7R5F3_TRANT|nr:hypothetical protein SAY86_019285 [Trapa natans]
MRGMNFHIGIDKVEGKTYYWHTDHQIWQVYPGLVVASQLASPSVLTAVQDKSRENNEQIESLTTAIYLSHSLTPRYAQLM